MSAVDRFADDCCPDELTEQVVTRVVFVNHEEKQNIDHIRGIGAKTQELIIYKALSRLNGNTRKRSFRSGSIKTKANAARQIGSSILSSIVPGDMGPIRSPIRSSIYRALTPGFGGGRGGSRPGENRANRCPEGYQYGGRFTDNRLSTCGAKLFDIPSAIGATIRAIREAGTSGIPTPQTRGRTITGLGAPEGIIQTRRPQIPRVGADNMSLSSGRAREAIREIGEFNKTSNLKVRRMVRRDGFTLEPVVPNKVLRAIPDNRDMEGATFIMSAISSRDIGGEELGLLSNTGIRSLVYVLPGGSTLSLSKARKLTVGERRKLGRVVNTAAKIPNSKDPAARLRSVASEIGDGISYLENFRNIKNPNEIVGGTTRWANQLFKNRKLTPETNTTARETVSFRQRGRLIKDLDTAINHLADGGSLSDIAPEIIAQVLAKSNSVQKQKLGNNVSIVSAGAKKYFMYDKPGKFHHIAERFASDLQQHLGLESPDVIWAAKRGDSRPYLREDVESAVTGGKFNPEINFGSLDPADVARMMVSDFLTDQRDRPLSSIYPIETADGVRAILAQNSNSGLTDLSKIEITKRTKMNIQEFYETQLTPSYSDYYQALQAEQRILFIKLISQMINRARNFNPNKFKNDMDGYGLSEGEKIHLNIISKLFEERLSVLQNQKQILRSIVTGGK